MSLADLFLPQGRASRLKFLVTILVSLSIQVLALAFVQAVQARLDLPVDRYFLVLALATLPFAWVMICAAIQRLSDLQWHWFPALPLVPAYFLPAAGMLGPGTAEGYIIASVLALYALISHAVLASRIATPAAPAALPPTVAIQPLPQPPAQQQQREADKQGLKRCPAGHYYDSKRNRLCPVCADSSGIAGGEIVPFRHVVGWMVVVEGPAQGKDFRLYAQQNRIGRAPDMEIQVEDASVAVRNHASIGYDPLTNTFRISPLESTILNGRPVETPSPLQPYDRISVGGSLLIFVPFCGPAYQWDLGAPESQSLKQ